MADTTGIEWCDSTFNPWMGCTRVSPACDDCYAARSTPARTMGVVWGPGQPRRRTSAANWKHPERWQRQAAEFYAAHGRRRRVFCASLADVFDNEVAGEWRDDLFRLIEATPALDWLLVTKRIGNVQHQVWPRWMQAGFPANVWLGITVVNQAEVDRDVPKLLRVPARVRFLSVEPMLGAIDAMKWLQPYSCADCGHHGSVNDCGPDGCEKCGEGAAFDGRETCKACNADDQHAKASCPKCGSHRSHEEDNGFIWSNEDRLISWIICGGESGPKARPMQAAWAQGLRDQCEAAGVAFLFKQWGQWLPAGQDGDPQAQTTHINASSDPISIGKKAAGRLLDGRTHDGFPGAA